VHAVVAARSFARVLSFVSACGAVAYAQPGAEWSAADVQHMRGVESGLPPVTLAAGEPPVALSLQRLMALYRVPGLSVAVIDGYKVVWAKGYGVTTAGGTTPVTAHTLFQAGSVSKPVAAAGALALVERGTLSLDEDVNRRLTSWHLPENENTRTQKVTLRRILSHTAGLTVHGFAGYAVGTAVPTLPQILDGEKPANSPAVRVTAEPGTIWRYSGGGAVLAQQLMIDAGGKPFPSLMRELVFDKLGMTDSTYEQPLPAERAGAAATGTDASGKTVPGRWHVYPEMAAGGLWTTPSDLAEFAIEIALAKHGKSKRIFSSTMAAQMLTPRIDVREIALGNEQHRDRMGLGFFLGDASRPDLFGHIGDDEGFQAMLMMYGDSGRGVVVMANSPFGIALGDIVVENVAREYGWTYVPPNRPRLGTGAVLRAADEQGLSAALRAYEALKKAHVERYPTNRDTLIGFAYALLSEGRTQDAIRVLDVEVAEFPDYWNAYDSLGEMYAVAGKNALAIRNYERSVALNPENAGGVEALEKLKARH